MYFIREGIVNVLSPNESQIVTNLTKGNYFGEIALFSKKARRICSVQAKTFCQIYILKKKDMENLFLEFPALEEKFILESNLNFNFIPNLFYNLIKK